MSLGLIVFMALFIKVCAVHTPSSNPKQPPARKLTLPRRHAHRSQVSSSSSSSSSSSLVVVFAVAATPATSIAGCGSRCATLCFAMIVPFLAFFFRRLISEVAWPIVTELCCVFDSDSDLQVYVRNLEVLPQKFVNISRLQ